MGFLTEITGEIRQRLRDHPLDQPAMEAAAAQAPPPRGLAVALRAAERRDGVAVLAEIKRASPSARDIALEADPVGRASAYEAGGAAAISVLTEPRYFGGTLDDLRAVRAAVRHPVLRKDFLLQPAQVVEARAAGADAVLLIAACLSDAELQTMLEIARELGMDPLLETHSDEDLERALATDVAVVGVNARDLESLHVDVPGALRRLGRIQSDRVAVLESGISTAADVAAAVGAGASAILVGEALMRAADPGSKLRELIAGIGPTPP
ncbi:MAG: indole-3-glycerol phosphate synthase TrpC [Actinomycetota bacterium]